MQIFRIKTNKKDESDKHTLITTVIIDASLVGYFPRYLTSKSHL